MSYQAVPNNTEAWLQAIHTEAVATRKAAAGSRRILALIALMVLGWWFVGFVILIGSS